MDYSVTIHQPDFMPWIGFFNKISKVDEWVVLDHVLNNVKDSAFWGRRVKMIINKSPAWISIPLIKDKGRTFIPINEMLINRSDQFFNQLKSIYYSYKKAPFFKQIFPIVESYFSSENTSLSELNIDFIKKILDGLNINVKISFSSELNLQSKSNELLLEILLNRNATSYRCGMGSKTYQNDKLFIDKNIEIIYNEYIPKPYEHYNSENFVPGLSIIDVLMNCGFDKTSRLLKEELI